jgi:chromosome transmission fidelity protein 1
MDSSGKAVKKSRGSSGCPYLQQKAVERLREEALLEVHDVEQLVTVGRKLLACPYYGSRAAVSDSQVCICICCSLFVVKSQDFSSWKVSENIITYRSQIYQFALSL